MKMVQQKTREAYPSLFLSFQQTLTCSLTSARKTAKQFYYPGVEQQKREIIFVYFVSTAVRCCDCAASSQQLYFYEHSQWKAHLCFFPGSGDSSPPACSKNRYRTQTICSPERPGGDHVQMGLLLLNSCFTKKIPSAFSMSQATRWFMWLFFLSFFHHPLAVIAVT